MAPLSPLPLPPRPLARGTSRTPLVAPERFEIVRRLGVGGMGVVYEAFDNDRCHTVALKTLRQLTGPALFRFKNEFRALAGIDHRNLVRLYELVSIDGEWLFTMELIRGGRLLERLRPHDAAAAAAAEGGATGAGETASGRRVAASEAATESLAGRPELRPEELPFPEQPVVHDVHTLPGTACAEAALVRDSVRQLAEGVAYLHARGRLHRDIKPSNILVTEEGRVVLCDFGLVTDLGRAPGHLTGTDHIVGTVSYMSPEQAVGQPLREASDWYSVGVVLYRALTGRVPFGNRRSEAMRLKQVVDPISPAVLAPGVPQDLSDLCDELLRRDPGERPSGDEILVRLGARRGVDVPARLAPSGDLVGRVAEIESLRSAYRQVKAGTGAVAFVHAASGMGKTSLVRAFLDEVEQEPDALVLSGRCYEQESLPYKAFDALIDSLSEHLAGMPLHEVDALVPADAQALSVLFPVLGRLDAMVAPARRTFRLQDPTEVRRRAFRAVRELLDNLARTRRVVLFIDDLQWGDLDSAALLASLMNRDDAPPILVVATYRSDEVDTSPLLGALVATGAGHDMSTIDVPLAPLSPDDAAALAHAVAAEAAHSIDAQDIARESAGNPMLVRELVCYSSGRSAGPLRSNIDAMLRSRVAALPRSAREVLALICAAGRPTPTAVVRRAADEDGDFADHLVTLRSQRLVRTRDTALGETVEPFHDRVRESVLAMLSSARAADCHGRIARTMQSIGRVDPEALVDHWLAAGECSHAATAAVAAAEQADRALAFDRAVRLYTLALELPTESAAARQQLRVRLAHALLNDGRGPEAARAFLEAAKSARAADALELKRKAALEYLCGGVVDEGTQILEEVMGSVGFRFARSPRRALLSLAARRVQAALRGVRFRQRDSSQVSAETLARIDVCWTAAVGLGFVDPIRGAELQTKHLVLALRAGEPERVVRALTAESCFRAVSGTKAVAAARQLTDLARSIADGLDNRPLRMIVRGAEAFGAYHAGRLADARDFAQDARRMDDGGRGMPWERVQASLFRIWACFYLGDLATMRDEVRATMAVARAHGDLYGTSSLDTGIPALVHLLDDAPDRLVERTTLALRAWSKTGFHVTHVWGAMALCQRDIYVGQPERALERLAEVWPQARAAQLLRVRVLRDELCDLRARAAIALAASVPAGAEVGRLIASARRDVRRLRRGGGWFGPIGAARRAGLEGDPTRAAELFEAAAAELHRGEMRLLATAARCRAAQAAGNEEAAAGFAEALRRAGVASPGALLGAFMPGVAFRRG